MDIEDCITQYEAIFDGAPWYGSPISQSLQEIPASFWDQKPAGASHSVSELVYHMIDWKIFVLEKLNDNVSYTIEMNSTADWRQNTSVVSDDEKERVIEELKKIHNEILEQLDQKPDSWLYEHVLGKEYTNAYMINGLLQHDVYHLGQINQLYSQLK